MNILLITIVCIILQLCNGEEKCGECMANEVYCVDETSYHFCMNRQPLTDEKFSCEKDHICTGDDRICVPKSEGGIKPICSSSCSECQPGVRYTCVSQTQYGRCVNNNIVLIGDCERDSICSLELMDKTNRICVPSCVADFFEASPTCGNEVATTTTTTTAAPTTPDFNKLRQQCQMFGETNKNNYFYIRNSDDIDCKSYIYCEKIGENKYEAILRRCKKGYFDGTSKCVPEKPESCDIEATTLQP